ncbi:MAG: Sua5/YciO/YrdC/YwlC family protein [Gammaproteobacteria bacterium]|nr:Sua5/YciO/YrdC/YwlC family protein [Gammaproteobacteria bacterium]
MLSVHCAAETLLRGGVIAYPTEGVFGLGCLPDKFDAVCRVLDIKQRSWHKGLILIGAHAGQFDSWIELPEGTSLPALDLQHPTTWVVPASDRVLPVVRGDHSTLAVRITSNPVAAAICDTVDSPLVSTSANLSGKVVARNGFILRRQFGTLVDYLVPGDCGPASGPSEIRDLMSGQTLRPGHK